MTRNQNHDDASSRERFKVCDNGGVPPWSDLNYDVLFLVMMQLEIMDFFAFSEVCKSWRSFALSNKNMFMTSKPPMLLLISNQNEFCLEDFGRIQFKTPLPYLKRTMLVGLTCGYLVLCRRETCDFVLVNPITRHQLYFPASPVSAIYPIKAILVFSRSINSLVIVMINRFDDKIWFCIAGKGAWNHVSSTFPILDLKVFKGKIYTINEGCRLYELRLYQEPKLTLLELKNFPKTTFILPEFVSSGENLYVMERALCFLIKFQELDFGEMKWVSRSPEENTMREYDFFFGHYTHNAAIKRESWAGPRSQYKRGDYFHDKSQKGTYSSSNMWYFPHDCLNVNLLDE